MSRRHNRRWADESDRRDRDESRRIGGLLAAEVSRRREHCRVDATHAEPRQLPDAGQQLIDAGLLQPCGLPACETEGDAAASDAVRQRRPVAADEDAA